MQVVSNGSRTDEQSPADLRVREAAKHQKEFAAPRWGCHLGRGQRPSLRLQRSRGGVMREARALPGPPARALSDDPRLWARLRSQAGSSAARKLHPSYPEQARSKRRGTQSPLRASDTVDANDHSYGSQMFIVRDEAVTVDARVPCGSLATPGGCQPRTRGSNRGPSPSLSQAPDPGRRAPVGRSR
jgi:hypothetical protein